MTPAIGSYLPCDMPWLLLPGLVASGRVVSSAMMDSSLQGLEQSCLCSAQSISGQVLGLGMGSGAGAKSRAASQPPVADPQAPGWATGQQGTNR